MWITKEMQADIEDKITWCPTAQSWITTLEMLSDSLAECGYKIDLVKVS